MLSAALSRYGQRNLMLHRNLERLRNQDHGSRPLLPGADHVRGNATALSSIAEGAAVFYALAEFNPSPLPWTRCTAPG
jgi:hypothetical protein